MDDYPFDRFIYNRKMNDGPPIALDAKMSVKFSQNRCILDDYWVFGGTRWSRFFYRMRRFPWIATKRAMRLGWRKVRRLFVKDPPPKILGR